MFYSLYIAMYIGICEPLIVNAKNHRNKSLHSKIIVQSCVTPEPEICREGLRMIVLSSCYEDSCFYDFLHCASLNHPSFDERFFHL